MPDRRQGDTSACSSWLKGIAPGSAKVTLSTVSPIISPLSKAGTRWPATAKSHPNLDDEVDVRAAERSPGKCLECCVASRLRVLDGRIVTFDNVILGSISNEEPMPDVSVRREGCI
jgi:hypothetical protein